MSRFQRIVTSVTSIAAVCLLAPLGLLAEVYYVSPDGSDSDPGALESPWQTIGRANETLSAGDTVLIRAGSYDDPIRPAASGSSEEMRITYRAFGDGVVVLTAVGDLGGNPEAEGAIALGGRRFVTVDGGEGRQIRALPGSRSFASLGNFTNAQHCVVESVVIDGSQIDSAGANVFLFNYLYSPANSESRFNTLRNSLLRGRTTSFAENTEDVIQLAGNAHHNIIEDNVLQNTFHVVLNAGQGVNAAGIRPYANVVRGNVIVNRFHTALSFYPGGADNLIEENTLIASGGLPASIAGGGNALQYSSEAGVIRYNLIAYGGSTDNSASIGGLLLSTGGDAPGLTVGNRVYHNTIVRNEGPGIGSFYWTDPGAIGRNGFSNNIIYGNHTQATSYFPGISVQYEGTHSLPGGIDDRYQNNMIGNPNGSDPIPDPSKEIIFDAIAGGVTAAEAEGFQGPEQPVFDDILQGDPGFVDYLGNDFRLAANSPLLEAGLPLTVVAVEDSGSGTVLLVDDARYFQAAEGFDSWHGVVPDRIAIGANPGDGSAVVVEIASVDKEAGRLTLLEGVTRGPGDAVWLWSNSRGTPVIGGVRPDVGAFERVLP